MNTEAASGLWRSEDMLRLDIVMQREAAHDTAFFIGLTGHAQFLDSNAGVTSFMRPYTSEVRRCDEMERKLRYLAEQVQGQAIPVLPVSVGLRQSAVPGRYGDALDRLESTVDAVERECRDLNVSLEGLQRQRDFLVESARVRSFVHFVSRDGMLGISNGTVPHLAGVIDTDQLGTLVRLAYRVTRGNCILRSTDMTDVVFEDPRDKSRTLRSCFIAISISQRMLVRLRRLVESLGAVVHDATQAPGGGAAAATGGGGSGMTTLESDNTSIIEQTQLSKRTLLTKVAATLESKVRQVRMEKAIFGTMNLFRFAGSTCQASLWVPKGFAGTIDAALQEAMITSRADVMPLASPSPIQDDPPTYFHTNKYLSIFQGIVDSYGIARYKELNPGVLTIVTFPYLFGIMYGDIGHGLLLTLFAGTLILLESRWEGRPLNEIFAMIFGGRYLLFAMGIFAIYIGALYNDFFGFSVGLLPSGYLWPELPAEGGPYGVVTPIEPNGRPGIRPSQPVAFGVDVAWAETENKLEFYNSIKMKCAVIVGVVQMTVGLIFSAMNHVYRKDWAKLCFSFIPEMVFLSCTFGYMSILILVKWCTPFENTHLAPSLLETMTNFFLSPGEVTVELFAGQAGLQVFLLLLAFSMTPVMLLVMPWIEIRNMRRVADAQAAESCRASRQQDVSPQRVFSPREEGNEQSKLLSTPSPAKVAADDDGNSAHHQQQQQQQQQQAHGSAQHDTTEIRIHYIIHTIEFVLGTVSNTASYLRLWALSLAHAQLSEVFFTFGLVQTITSDTTGIMTVLGSAVWLGATVGVLLGMEALSAFLHALRLHWVEFQNKFYVGDGHAFEPLLLLEINGVIQTKPSE